MIFLVLLVSVIISSIIITAFRVNGILLGGIPTVLIYIVVTTGIEVLYKYYRSSKEKKAAEAAYRERKELAKAAVKPENSPVSGGQQAAGESIPKEGSAGEKYESPPVKYCRKCGKPLTEGDKSCGYCGTKK